MSERTALVDEELPVDGIVDFGVPGMEAVPLNWSNCIAIVDDPSVYLDYGLGGFVQVPAVIVPEGTVRGGDRLHVTVELATGGADE